MTFDKFMAKQITGDKFFIKKYPEYIQLETALIK